MVQAHSRPIRSERWPITICPAMPAKPDEAQRPGGELRLKPVSTRYLVWWTWTPYQANRPPKNAANSHQKRASRIASASVHSVAAQRRSTTLSSPPGGAAAAAAPGRRRARGRGRPAGSRCRARLSGTTTASSRPASAQQAARQPLASIRLCSQGNSTIAPTPTPENAMPVARPRRRTNQCGRISEWPM